MLTDIEIVIVAVIIGTFAGLLWSIRVLYSLNLKIASIEQHLLKIVTRIEKEEKIIEAEERKIEKKLNIK
jgi:hypothetical protein